MILREMLVDDLDQVMEIEEELFFSPLDKRRISDISYEREWDVSCCGRKGPDPGILWSSYGAG